MANLHILICKLRNECAFTCARKAHNKNYNRSARTYEWSAFNEMRKTYCVVGAYEMLSLGDPKAGNSGSRSVPISFAATLLPVASELSVLAKGFLFTNILQTLVSLN